jgi:hypothetical protein
MRYLDSLAYQTRRCLQIFIANDGHFEVNYLAAVSVFISSQAEAGPWPFKGNSRRCEREAGSSRVDEQPHSLCLWAEALWTWGNIESDTGCSSATASLRSVAKSSSPGEVTASRVQARYRLPWRAIRRMQSILLPNTAQLRPWGYFCKRELNLGSMDQCRLKPAGLTVLGDPRIEVRVTNSVCNPKTTHPEPIGRERKEVYAVRLVFPRNTCSRPGERESTTHLCRSILPYLASRSRSQNKNENSGLMPTALLSGRALLHKPRPVQVLSGFSPC